MGIRRSSAVHKKELPAKCGKRVIYILLYQGVRGFLCHLFSFGDALNGSYPSSINLDESIQSPIWDNGDDKSKLRFSVQTVNILLNFHLL